MQRNGSFQALMTFAILLLLASGMVWMKLRSGNSGAAVFKTEFSSKSVDSRDLAGNSALSAGLRRRQQPLTEGTHDDNPFVGNASCLKCHSDVWQHYQHSGMSQTLRKVDATVAATVDGPVRVTDSQNQFAYEILVQENGRGDPQVRFTETFSGDKTWHRTVAAAYRIGSGKHAFGLVSDFNGHLKQLPLAWYAHDGKWALSPGYELKNRRFGRSIRAECLACHGGETRQTVTAANHFAQPLADGISCERCHGPGHQHELKHQQQGHTKIALNSSGDPTIVNPGRLVAERANDVCLQCHLQGDVVIYQPDCDAFSFRPGDRLQDHRSDFLAKTNDGQAFGVASHGARMLLSKCWSASSGQLTCILCHDAHHAVEQTPVLEFDRTCQTCHAVQDCHRSPADLTKNGEATESSCVRCHMPQRSTREQQHLVFTDHLIQIPPTKTVQETAAPPVISINAQIELVHSRSDLPPDQHLLGAAYVKLHETMGPQQPSLEKGMALLQASLQQQSRHADVHYWLGSAQISLRQPAAAIKLLEPLVAANPDWLEARFRLGIAYDQLGQYDRAISMYADLLEAEPEWLEPYPLLSRLYLYRQQPAAAVELLRSQLQQVDDPEAHAALAIAYRLQKKPLAESLVEIDRALALDPLLINAYLNRGFLLAEAGQLRAARQDFLKVLQIDPQHAKAQAGLQSLGPER